VDRNAIQGILNKKPEPAPKPANDAKGQKSILKGLFGGKKS